MRSSTDRLIAVAPTLRKPDEVLDMLQSVSLKHPQRLKVLSISSNDAIEPEGFKGKMGRDIFYRSDFAGTQFLTEYQALEKKYGYNALKDYQESVSHPYTFSEALHALQLTGEARWTFDLLGRFGVRDGLLVTHGHWLVVYSAEQPLQLERDQRFQLSMAAGVAVEWMERFVQARRRPPIPKLSDRQLVILHMFAHGLTADEIAGQLNISVGTVRTYVRRILEKMKAHSIAHAVNIAWLTRNFDR